MKRLSFALLIILLISCGDEPTPVEKILKPESADQPLFKLHDTPSLGIDFINKVEENEDVNCLIWDAVFAGGGVGIGDINNDGYSDLFFAGNQVNDALYLNKGNWEFENISQSSGITSEPGWSSGVSMIDINNDGFLDIYVSRDSWQLDKDNPDFRKNKLYINNGDLTFTERSEEYGLDQDGYGTQAAFLDFDRDGDLDMYLLNSPSNNILQKIYYQRQNFIPGKFSDQFYVNEGGTFKNSTQQVGVKSTAFGLGVIATDINHDNWVDLYIANDYDYPDFAYINNKDGTFSNRLNETFKHTAYTAMGCDAGDINNDGLTDLAVLDMQSPDHFRSKTNMPSMDIEAFWSMVNKGFNHQYMSNVLQINNGLGYFSDVAQMAGVASTEWSWAVLLADFDNDSFKDIFVSNGVDRDVKNNDFLVNLKEQGKDLSSQELLTFIDSIPSNPVENFMFRNNGDLTFSNINSKWNLDQISFSYGAAYGDIDNDGDLDLIVNNNNEPPFIYENQRGNENHYLKAKVSGSATNPFGIGTKVFIYVNGSIQYQELNPARGYQSSMEPKFLFGLGDKTVVDSLICIFADGKTLRKFSLNVDQELELKYNEAAEQMVNVYDFEKKVFRNTTLDQKIDFKHKENERDDYLTEILLPHSQSKLGPFEAVGDINNDGLEDFFVGGAAGQAGQLFVQNQDGSFTKTNGPWTRDKEAEDMGCVFLDVDGNGLLDLYVSSGGYAQTVKKAFRDRLYLNRGRSLFEKRNDLIPDNEYNSGIVIKNDYDNDGDIDLFVAGRGASERYPYPGRSVILKNELGVLKDVTEEIAPDLSEVGMVTSCVWSDCSADGLDDLILVGEWMKPTAFLQDSIGFLKDEDWIKGNDQLGGWWYHVNAADLNGDGKDDFVLGNIGINNKFHPSPEKPLRVFSSDFDQNSTNDIVLAKEYKGKIVPTRGRECSSEQMPFIAEKFESFESFANASLDEILGEELDRSLAYEAKEFRSGVLLSTTEGYEFQSFTNMAQISPILSSVIRDFNKDGILDILVAGNMFDAEVETTRHDSGNGLLLRGNSTGGYDALTIMDSGFYAPGNVKSMALLENNANDKVATIIVGTNNGALSAFSYAKY